MINVFDESVLKPIRVFDNLEKLEEILKKGKLIYTNKKFVLLLRRDCEILWEDGIYGEPCSNCGIFWAETLIELIEKL